jgi:hypothetical protein
MALDEEYVAVGNFHAFELDVDADEEPASLRLGGIGCGNRQPAPAIAAAPASPIETQHGAFLWEHENIYDDVIIIAPPRFTQYRCAGFAASSPSRCSA